QGFALHYTHTFSSSWLNEFRFGWSSIKFFMTPIDYQQNLAKGVGIPGINLGTDTTSAMSQIIFTTTTNGGNGSRNLGANANQPLITNQNDFQIFDNVTRVAGRHTLKAGGSYTHRSREILNADTIVGRFDFNQNLTSSCGGVTGTCTPLANTGFDVASFLLGYASNASRTLFNDGTYTELRPEFASYFQDDFRVTGRLTLHAGRHLAFQSAESALPQGAGEHHELRDQRRAVAGTAGAARGESRRRPGWIDTVRLPDRLPRRARAQLQHQRAAAVRQQLHDR